MRSALLDDSESRNLIYVPGDVVCLLTKEGMYKPKERIGRIVSVSTKWLELDMSEKFISNTIHIQMSEIIGIEKIENRPEV